MRLMPPENCLSPLKADYEHMVTVYNKGEYPTDDALSEEISTRAVIYNGGWLIRAGNYYGTKLHLYCLSEIEELP